MQEINRSRKFIALVVILLFSMTIYQNINFDKLFDYSKLNPNSISFSQKKLTDGDRFIVKIKNIDSVSKAIKVLEDINT